MPTDWRARVIIVTMRLMTLFMRTKHEPSGSRRAGAGEPVLLIHPFMLSHHSWRPVMDRLSRKGYDVMAVSMPGHYGGPRLGWRQSTFWHMVDHLEHEMDKVGWETAHIVGNSLGGWATLELARRGRARTAMPIAPAGGYDGLGPRDVAMGLAFIAAAVARTPLRIGHALGPNLLPFKHLGLKAMAHQPRLMDPADAHHVIRTALGATDPLQVLTACIRSIPAVGLETIDVPVHLVFAEKDIVIPPKKYAPYFMDRLPHAQVTMLEGVGHCPQIEQPDVIVDLIRATIARQVVVSRRLA